MYQAITVKYLTWTSHKPARYRASCNAKSITWSLGKFPNDGTISKDHEYAIYIARHLAIQLKWQGKWHGGVDSKGQYQFVIECPSLVTGSFMIDDDAC